MARLTFAVLFLLVALVAMAHAELLPRLHVLDFKMSSDTRHPQAGIPFHVTVTVRVRERVTQLQYVYVPAFSNVQTIGDRRTLSHAGPGGTTYRETLTLLARRTGALAIGSAYLDAVDLRDNKTKRFISNDLILTVMGNAAPGTRPLTRNVLLAILALLLAVGALIAVTMRRRKLRPADPKPEPAASAPEREAPMALDEALATLRARRDRSSVLAVRDALRHVAGARDGETLSDVLGREAVRADGLRARLIAIEHAAFVREARLQQAIDDALR